MTHSNRKGFTIVELVIVIAVIAILAAVLIPTFSNIIRKANDSAALQEAENAMKNVLTMSDSATLNEGTMFYFFGKSGSTVNTNEIKYAFKFTHQKLDPVKTTTDTPSTCKQFVVKKAPQAGHYTDGTDPAIQLLSGMLTKLNISADNVDFSEGGRAVFNEDLPDEILVIMPFAENEKPDAPASLVGVAPQSAAASDGKITGLRSDKSYEYKLATNNGYTSVAAQSTEITSLAAGVYDVRFAADNQNPPSKDFQVTVPEYSASN